MTGPALVVERPLEQVAVVRINRPEVHNALNRALVTELRETIGGLAESAGTRAIVLTATGQKAFSAGADLRELTGLDEPAAQEVLGSGQAAFRAIEQCRVPVIAAVNGVALGGGFELVLSCTFSVLSERATLGLPETGLGLIPGYGGTQRLTRLLGPAAARFVMLTGRRIDAGLAHRWAITPVPPVAADDLLDHAVALAAEIAARGPSASTQVLDLVDLASGRMLDQALAAETRAAAAAVSSREGAEGIRAFTARETPDFEASQ